MLYRYSPDSQSWKTPRKVLLAVRAAAFESRILRLDSVDLESGSGLQPLGVLSVASAENAAISKEKYVGAKTSQGMGSFDWSSGFLIWGAGRDGTDFYRALTGRGKGLVRGFVDIDPKRIGTTYPPGKDGVPVMSP